MDNGSGGVGFTDAGVLALLADTNRAGRGGFGWGEGGHGAYGPYASVATLQHGQEDLSRQHLYQSDITRDQFTAQAARDAIGAIGAAINNTEQRLSDRLRDSELNALRESGDLARQIAACCCDAQKAFLETQKQILIDGQKTRDLISENTLRAAVDANNVNATVGPIVAAGNANTAAIVAAIQAKSHHGGH
jgi:hypothetical protein